MASNLNIPLVVASFLNRDFFAERFGREMIR
jgi:hypothetical protein